VKKPNVLFYDIETSPVKAYIWKCGDQVVRHNQLVEGASQTKIISLAYAFNNDKVQTLHWDYEKQDDKIIVKEFTRLTKLADIIIGKNNNAFDNKHIHTRLMFHKLSSSHDLMLKSEDLERQMRRYFNLQSFSLDYISNELGLGGKVKMELSDWIDIVEKKNIKSFHKMIKYGEKDVDDTRKIWNYCFKYFIPTHNLSALLGKFCCRVCGSHKIVKDGSVCRGSVVYQKYFCNEHDGYAGMHPRHQLNPKILR
jgi:DNA polymerase elongation subunit (family B)